VFTGPLMTPASKPAFALPKEIVEAIIVAASKDVVVVVLR
jgi:hypothetical protein